MYYIMMFEKMQIPMGIPAWSKKDIMDVFKSFLSGEIFFTSKFKERLKNIICETLGVKYCLLTEFGRVALEIGLKALGLKPGDGIILPSYICPSVLLPILRLKCEPQFADIGEDLNISSESIKKAIKPNTKVIIVPHLYGKPAPIKEILDIAKEKGLYVIDDAAQCLGAKVHGQYIGTFGNFGILSFSAFKFITGSKGGALITNDTSFFREVLKIKITRASEIDAFDKFLKSLIKFKYRKYSYHLLKKYRSRINNRNNITYKYKLPIFPREYTDISNLDAILIYAQMKKLEQLLVKRKYLAENLFSFLLNNCPDVLIKPHLCRNNKFLKFVIKLPSHIDRSKFLKNFHKKGIEAQKGYTPLHLNINYNRKLPVTESIWSSIVTLPINHDTDIHDIEYIGSCLIDLLK